MRGDEWSLREFASMPSTAIFLRTRAEIKNLLCELASLRATQKFGEHEQASTRLDFASISSKGKILRAVKNWMDHSSPLKCINVLLSIIHRASWCNPTFDGTIWLPLHIYQTRFWNHSYCSRFGRSHSPSLCLPATYVLGPHQSPPIPVSYPHPPPQKT